VESNEEMWGKEIQPREAALDARVSYSFWDHFGMTLPFFIISFCHDARLCSVS
jgi:hypothetical protein